MQKGISIARDFFINPLGRVRLVQLTDATYQVLYKFFSSSFKKLIGQKVTIQFTGSLQGQMKSMVEQFVASQQSSINFSLFQGTEVVKEITVVSVKQITRTQFSVSMLVTLASNTAFPLVVTTTLV